ncbi:MAG: hypothetical protein KJ952_05455, partial [Candidatus Omnitrophica bacterium]|nr:hypothetical protein [Candidatus Omnitrophota bacterium]
MGKLLTMDYAIEIKNLKKIFFERKGFTEILRCPFKRKEGKLVLYNVNLGIEKGSIFCLLGPNGAG